jgi:DNA (cytosine-5)-methyltransferase 1
MTKNLRIVSLFSGCGGMDLGSEGGFKFLSKTYKKHPVEIVQAFEIEPTFVSIYNLNFNVKAEMNDIRNIESKDISNHEILTGGFPCQSFSVVAQNPKRLGFKDEKGRLFFEICRILKEKSPKVFIAENVKGILSANNKEAFPLIIKEFESCGYHVKFKVLNASHYGVPQKRERVFIIGFKNKSEFDKFNFPEPLTISNPVPISLILENEDSIPKNYYFSDKAVIGMRSTKNSKSMNKGRAQDIALPCNTVTAHLAKVSLNSTDPVLCINGKYRMFTPREVARIQSFPDRFKLAESRSVQYRTLGNAVAPVLMWHIMKSVLEALE